MTIIQGQERRVFSSGILRFVGYSLLLMTVVNVSFLLISAPQSITPLWEFQTMGAIVERIPVTLLGMVFVYYGKRSDRTPIEAILLQVLSWGSLLAAILLILIVPLNISNGFKIYNQHDVTANAMFDSQKATIQQFKEQLAATDSQAEIGAILAHGAKQQVNIPDSVNIQKLKADIIVNLEHNQDGITSQSEAFRAQKHSLLFKKCLKWNLGALISSILFFIIWKSTIWARSMVDQPDYNQ